MIHFNIDLLVKFTEISQMNLLLFIFTSHVLKIHNVLKAFDLCLSKTNG